MYIYIYIKYYIVIFEILLSNLADARKYKLESKRKITRPEGSLWARIYKYYTQYTIYYTHTDTHYGSGN